MGCQYVYFKLSLPVLACVFSSLLFDYFFFYPKCTAFYAKSSLWFIG